MNMSNNFLNEGGITSRYSYCEGYNIIIFDEELDKLSIDLKNMLQKYQKEITMTQSNCVYEIKNINSKDYFKFQKYISCKD